MLLSLYEMAWRPAAAMIGGSDAQRAHDRTVELLRASDGHSMVASAARATARALGSARPVEVGGVRLPSPIVVAAGLVKGDGFADEASAMAAVAAGRDIVPGHRTIPALTGAVEFGSFTRHPRLGNSGRVVWREPDTDSMQNRVGLRNPGARAAATHLRANVGRLPRHWGVNVAVSPGVAEPALAGREVAEAAAPFHQALGDVERGPSWLTVNLSCPNTDDDPRGTQSAELARAVCGTVVRGSPIPVWAKIGPDLSDAQLEALVGAFAETGVAAVVATNTWAQPVPGSTMLAGVSGARLRPMALQTVTRLRRIVEATDTSIDIVASGGILSGAHLRAFQRAGARAAMVYSALVIRGPFAPALILREAEQCGHHA